VIVGAGIVPTAPLLVPGASASLPSGVAEVCDAIDQTLDGLPDHDVAVLVAGGSQGALYDAAEASLAGVGVPQVRITAEVDHALTERLSGLVQYPSTAASRCPLDLAVLTLLLGSGAPLVPIEVPGGAAFDALTAVGVGIASALDDPDVRGVWSAPGTCRRASTSAHRCIGSTVPATSTPGSSTSSTPDGSTGWRASAPRRRGGSAPGPGRPWRSSTGRSPGRRSGSSGGTTRRRAASGTSSRTVPEDARDEPADATPRAQPAAGTLAAGPPVLAVVGPTAAGKSAVALAAAERLAASGVAVEIVAVDAFTVYRGMDVGTAKPTAEERERVPHHGLDLLDPDAECTAEWFQGVARDAIAGIRARGRVPLLVGGSGLYFRTVVDPLEFPPTDANVRAAVARRFGDDPVGAHRALAAADPDAAARIDPANLRRTVRALEVLELTGRPFSAWRRAWDDHASVYGDALRVIGIAVDRDELRARIDARVDAMVAGGLVEECRRCGSAGRSCPRPPARRSATARCSTTSPGGSPSRRRSSGREGPDAPLRRPAGPLVLADPRVAVAGSARQPDALVGHAADPAERSEGAPPT
jgi:tRNA dimethylallyltransferase